jgi:ubiquinone/menaquinone biosynthesis C-methylase UbiE
MNMLTSLKSHLRNGLTPVRKYFAQRRVADPRFPAQDLRLYSTTLGPWYLPLDRRGDFAATEIHAGREATPGLIQIARGFIRNGTIAIDIGSGYGQAVMEMSALVGSSGQVLAFEPDTFRHYVLRRNLDARVVVNVRAYWAQIQEHSTRSGTNDCLNVALDDLGIADSISFMNVDAHAFAAGALLGAVRTLQKNRMPVLIEHGEGADEQLRDILSDPRFACYTVRQTERRTQKLLLPKTDDDSFNRTEPPPMRNDTATTQFNEHLSGFLQNRQEVEESTRYLHRYGYCSHIWPCKDWDLALIIREIGDGNLLDMGSSDSYILKNAVLKRTRGDKVGIDLRLPDAPIPGVQYLVGDLLAVPVPPESFQYLTCLSVIEHEVDFARFADECARLLVPGGKLFVTFDYWEPTIRPKQKLYDRAWKPLDASEVARLLGECKRAGLQPVHAMDWSLGEPVIREGYYSPESGIRYTFGILAVEKCASRS